MIVPLFLTHPPSLYWIDSRMIGFPMNIFISELPIGNLPDREVFLYYNFPLLRSSNFCCFLGSMLAFSVVSLNTFSPCLRYKRHGQKSGSRRLRNKFNLRCIPDMYLPGCLFSKQWRLCDSYLHVYILMIGYTYFKCSFFGFLQLNTKK